MAMVSSDGVGNDEVVDGEGAPTLRRDAPQTIQPAVRRELGYDSNKTRDAGSGPVGQLTPPQSAAKTGLFIGASAGAVVLICLILSAVWFCLRRKKTKVMTARSPALDRGNPIPMEEEEDFAKWMGPRRFGYSELAIATRFFSDEEKLGQGGFGSVYRGYLKETNMHVAVKRVSKGSRQGKKEHEIILGVGSALLYLHEEWEQCVLHRDIKPSNLMLDASFNVKLGDFGLARLVDHGQGARTTMLIGTMGYMDPESMVTGKASRESDIYSFGVVILEIISGRRPIATMQLVQLVWELYGDARILDAVDTRLNGEFDSQEVERMMVAALWCVHPDKSQRPSIRQAVNVMRSDAPSPILPAKMPVATFVFPVDSILSQSIDTTETSGRGSYETGTRSTGYGTRTTCSSSGVHTSSLPR
ncbi:hypothetical protein QYE76_019528 [Lolium multiflorum]|uniref:Protein kinase domain-containing protein n=1 Tax=Lolium multiflorum TaxID=4521 RepID=A0AAD8R450_LOLMU|nr:hypothetical protein QYE76_019528 [Lolium multiflorum]